MMVDLASRRVIDASDASRSEPLGHDAGGGLDPSRRSFCLQACCGLAWLGLLAPVQQVVRTATPSPPVARVELEVDVSDLSDPGWTY
jgi:hypothetical protein